MLLGLVYIIASFQLVFNVYHWNIKAKQQAKKIKHDKQQEVNIVFTCITLILVLLS